MMYQTLMAGCVVLCVAILSDSVKASTSTIGPNGINSAGLTLANGMPMNGGSVGVMPAVAIGEVDLMRAGKPIANGGFDDTVHSSPDVIPTDVFRRTTSGAGIANQYTGDHAEEVASIIIGKDLVDPDGGGPRSAPTGIALGAALYSSAFDPIGPNFDEEAAVTTNHLATLPGIDVRAINMSFGNPLAPGHTLFDGNQHLTQFVDWSAAAAHDVLYVVAGNEGTMDPIPTDNFNGITAAYSTIEGGVYRRVAAGNTFDEDAEGDRTSIGLLAPGNNVDVTALNAVAQDSGTSFAAPHVTATAALLQQYANERILNGGWIAANSRRHETMKAVLMNSADKLIDNGTVTPPGEVNPVPQGGLLGMTRTVLKQDGISTWLNSSAYDDSIDGGGAPIPLDEQMGAGHLNASRALQQFSPGEHDSDGADVPALGWDFGHTTGQNDVNKYAFAQQLLGKSFVSVTLAWDRVVSFANDTAPVGQYNSGDSFAPSTSSFPNPENDDQINDLNLYLLPKGAFSLTQTIAQSRSNVGTLEHIFFQIPSTGEYELWVRQEDADISGGQDYAVAWWAIPELTPTQQGDYNGDHIVNGADYNIWKGSFGLANAAADGNGNGIVDAADYVIWREHNGQMVGSGSLAAVPEPGSIALAVVCLLSFTTIRRLR